MLVQGRLNTLFVHDCTSGVVGVGATRTLDYFTTVGYTPATLSHVAAAMAKVVGAEVSAVEAVATRHGANGRIHEEEGRGGRLPCSSRCALN